MLDEPVTLAAVSLPVESASAFRAARGKWAAVYGVTAFCVLTAVAAQVRVPIPGTPVPMTLQTLVVLLSGVALGPWLGVASQGLYLLVGLCGVPVFAEPGAGPQYVFGATGGYLMAFLLVPFVVGRITATSRGASAMVLAALSGTILIFGLGVGWLAVLLGDVWEALQVGLFPFWIGAILKCGLAAALGHRLWPMCRRIW